MHERGGVAQVTEPRRLESGNGSIQQDGIGQKAGHLVIAQEGSDFCLWVRYVRIRKDIPDTQIGQRRVCQYGNRSERFECSRVGLGCREKLAAFVPVKSR